MGRVLAELFFGIFDMENIITAVRIPESQRMDVADEHFGIRFPLTVEPMIYQFATQLASAYSGGYWHFYSLSDGGFFMAPEMADTFEVVADNGYQDTMTAEALGITACLYAFSNLSFTKGPFGEKCADRYHQLYEFAMQHPEAAAIRSAID